MKNILYTLILILTVNTSFSQSQYDDLRILYADGSYEKLVKAADKYTLSDKTKKDPMPYMWLSKGLYKLHVGGNTDPAFKNAYKESINAMNKFIKMDKTGEYLSDVDNQEFLDVIQGSVVEQIENELSSANFKKSLSWVTSYKKISQNLLGQMLMEGACKFRSDDKTTAFTLWKTVDSQLKGVTSIENWTKADKQMLKLGAIHTAECYVSIKKVDNAKDLLNKVAQWFEDDSTFKDAYNNIVN